MQVYNNNKIIQIQMLFDIYLFPVYSNNLHNLHTKIGLT